jgi:hypothetical protein
MPNFSRRYCKRAESEAEELGGLGDVVVRLLHRLRDQVALDVFEIDSFGRQLERAFRCWSNILTHFGRQVFGCDQIAFTQEESRAQSPTPTA